MVVVVVVGGGGDDDWCFLYITSQLNSQNSHDISRSCIASMAPVLTDHLSVMYLRVRLMELLPKRGMH